MVQEGRIREDTEERFWEKQTVAKVWLLYTLCKVETDTEKDPQSGNTERNRQTQQERLGCKVNH